MRSNNFSGISTHRFFAQQRGFAHSRSGFTLLELMVTVVMIAIMAMVAIPSYQNYIRSADEANAKQEMQKLSTELEKSKSRNFTYSGFALSNIYTLQADGTVALPIGGSIVKYSMSLSSTSTTWAIKAVPKDVLNYTLLLTSAGLSCKNTDANQVSYTGCGTGAVSW